MEPLRSESAVLRDLHRALVRRRFAQIEPKLRLELAALAVLIGAFLFWHTRVSFDGLARLHGPLAVLEAAAGLCAVLAALGGALAGTRHAARLHDPPGPPWLALPLPPEWLARHLAWESRAFALGAIPAAPGILFAAVGLVPLWWLGLLAAAFVWMVLVAGRIGCALASFVMARRAPSGPSLHPLVRTLAAASHPVRGAPHRAVRWRARPAWRALCEKDLLLSLRPTAARRRLVPPLLLGLLSLSCWALPAPPALAHLSAFALALGAAGTLGEWLIALSGEDPFMVLRGLPLGVGVIWGSRAAWAMAFAAALVLAHAASAGPLGPEARTVFLVWTGGAALAIALLGVNYGVTLFPRAEIAQRLYALSLLLAVAGSLMIPLMGWIVLLAALIHSALRLPGWARLEEPA